MGTSDDWAAMHALGREMQKPKDVDPIDWFNSADSCSSFEAMGWNSTICMRGMAPMPFSLKPDTGRLCLDTQPSSFRSYFRWYNPVEPAHHTRQGLSAALVLVRSGSKNSPPLGPPDRGPVSFDSSHNAPSQDQLAPIAAGIAQM